MINSSASKKLTKEQREALLVEYQACQKEQHYHGSTYWTIVGIFLSFITAIAAYIIKNILETNNDLLNSNSNERWVILGLSLLALLIIVFLFLWLKRTNKFVDAARQRRLAIADQLDMQLDNKMEKITNKGTPLKGICIAAILFTLAAMPWVFLAIISASKCVKVCILG